MKKLQHCFHKEEGFSLTELLIVILIVIVISTLALMQLGNSKEQLSRQNVAIELKNAFERARFDSVKRRATGSARANVVVSQNSFILNTDIDQNGTIESGEARTNSSWMSGVAIYKQDGTALSSDVTVTFDNRGEVTTAPSGEVATFLICNGDCSTPSSSNANLLLVTLTGTVNILPGNDSVPTFATPGVTTISNNSSINPDVTLY